MFLLPIPNPHFFSAKISKKNSRNSMRMGQIFHSFSFWFNNFWETKEMGILLWFPITLAYFLPWNSRIIPGPIVLFVYQGPKKGPKIPFISKKCRQVRGVRTRVPQISGEALVGRPKWRKKIILMPIIVFIDFEEKRGKVGPFSKKSLFS